MRTGSVVVSYLTKAKPPSQLVANIISEARTSDLTVGEGGSHLRFYGITTEAEAARIERDTRPNITFWYSSDLQSP